MHWEAIVRIQINIIVGLLLGLATSQVFANSHTNFLYGQSIEETSAQFLTMPYCKSPLGEGADGQFDQDPRCRFDKFDCQTYVETVLAMSRSDDHSSFEREMDLIRYHQGIVSFATRLHFSETQWIPENENRGYFTDITGSQSTCEEHEVTVNVSKWYQAKKHEDLNVACPAEDLLCNFQNQHFETPPTTAAFSYFPLEVLDGEFIKNIPSETIILFVRKNDKPEVGATPIMVTHMGFVVGTFSGKVLRHAAYGDQVKDVNLQEYIDKFKLKSGAPTWASVGIKLLKPKSKSTVNTSK
jgi:hypothetical protein